MKFVGRVQNRTGSDVGHVGGVRHLGVGVVVSGQLSVGDFRGFCARFRHIPNGTQASFAVLVLKSNVVVLKSLIDDTEHNPLSGKGRFQSCAGLDAIDTRVLACRFHQGTEAACQ